MTFEEALATAIKAKEKWGGGSSEAWLINAMVSLGVLKLDEPKGPNERAVDAMFAKCISGTGTITPRHAIEAIHNAGLQIVSDPPPNGTEP